MGFIVVVERDVLLLLIQATATVRSCSSFSSSNSDSEKLLVLPFRLDDTNAVLSHFIPFHSPIPFHHLQAYPNTVPSSNMNAPHQVPSNDEAGSLPTQTFFSLQQQHDHRMAEEKTKQEEEKTKQEKEKTKRIVQEEHTKRTEAFTKTMLEIAKLSLAPGPP